MIGVREAWQGAAQRASRRTQVHGTLFRLRYGFAPPPPWSDLTGYEPILDTIAREGLHELRGDVLEIGVLMGGGTAKLCGYFARHAPAKRVIAVDVFDPAFDTTSSPGGFDMATLYAHKIAEAGSDQRSIFDAVAAHCPNLVVVAGDSAQVEIPADELVFSFVDGNHTAEYVRGDFERAWSRTVSGGIVALHDYGGDLRPVTVTIQSLIGEYADEIDRLWVDGVILYAKKC